MKNEQYVLMKIAGSEPEEFVIVFLNSHSPSGEPFMRTTDPLSEEEIRVELTKTGCTIVEIETLIQRACWLGVRSLNENYRGSQRNV